MLEKYSQRGLWKRERGWGTREIFGSSQKLILKSAMHPVGLDIHLGKKGNIPGVRILASECER